MELYPNDVSRQPHFAFRHRDRNRRQPFAFAGPGQAMAVLEPEERAMGGAEDAPALEIEELVLDPVQRPAGMGAGIDIGRQHGAAADQEDGAIFELEATAAGIGDLGEAAEQPARRLAHPFTPPIWQICFQCAAETGETESRERRTKARSANCGSALIAFSVTGVFSGATGVMSTMPRRPDLSAGSG